MTVSEEKASHTDVDNLESALGEINDYDITRILVKTGHTTKRLENGISIAIRLTGIPETRGVHVEVVHVLDLRKAKFGKSLVGMKSQVLDVINHPLDKILSELSLQKQLVGKSIRTLWGKVSLQLLAPNKAALKKNRISMIHETRIIYVVSDDVRPSYDLTWITDESRILSIDEFTIARASDARTTLPELQKSIDSEKWESLQIATQMSFYALLGISLVTLAALAIVIAYFEQSWLFPVIGLLFMAGIGITLYYSYHSRKQLNTFRSAMNTESSKISVIGDSKRIDATLELNHEQLSVVNELNFIIPTLIGSTLESFVKKDIDACIHYTSVILDECVRLSPSEYNSDHNPFSADKGLSKFLGLFQYLEVDYQDGEVELLALAYSDISGHLENAISIDEMVNHLTNLYFVMFNAGLIPPQLKERIDTILNTWGLDHAHETLVERSETDSSDQPIPDSEKLSNESVSEPDEKYTEDYSSFLEDITDSDFKTEYDRIAEPSESEIAEIQEVSSPSEDEIPYRHRKALLFKKAEKRSIASEIRKKAEALQQEIQDSVHMLGDEE